MADPPAGVVVHGSRVPGRLTVHPRFQGEPTEMTEEQRAAQIRALVEERRSYEVRGLPDRVAEVDAQLRRLGAEGAPRVKRAESRPTNTQTEKRST